MALLLAPATLVHAGVDTSAPAGASACGLSVAEQQAVTAQVAGYLQDRLNAGQSLPARVSLVPMGAWPALRDARVAVSAGGLPTSLRSRVPVPLTGLSCRDGRQVSETLWFRASALRQAWVYGRDAGADRDLAEAAPRLAEVDLARLQLVPDELVSDVNGQWLKQAAMAGRPVLRRHLRVTPLVHRDAVVTVVVQGDGLVLSAKGKALQHGALGEQVAVLVQGADGSIPAVVTGKGEVHARM